MGGYKRAEWSTVIILLTCVFFGTAAAAAVDGLAGSIIFLVFAGGVMVLVFYAARQNGRWATPYLSLFWVMLPFSFAPFFARRPMCMCTSSSDVTLLSLLLVGGLVCRWHIRVFNFTKMQFPLHLLCYDLLLIELTGDKYEAGIFSKFNNNRSTSPNISFLLAFRLVPVMILSYRSSNTLNQVK